jgi:hypothetical protein
MIQSMISDIVLWFLVTLLFLGGVMPSNPNPNPNLTLTLTLNPNPKP